MAGVLTAIRLREFTNAHPQITVEEIGILKAPRTGRTVHGLYVGQIGRIHPSDSSDPMTTPKYNLSFPEISDIEPIEIGPWNPFETTYNLHYPSDVDPIDRRYTPTSHKAPLPAGAKAPPTLGTLNPHLVKPSEKSNNSIDWNTIPEKQ